MPALPYPRLVPPASGPLVAVVGGGLAGMAAAARLAKMGHRVRLHEASGPPGGLAAYALPARPRTARDLVVDDAPAVLDLPGAVARPVPQERPTPGGRAGPRRVRARPPPQPRGTTPTAATLALPSDRGEQHEVLLRTYGPGPAARWQHLLDSLDDVWQALRPLGLEEPYEPDR